MLIAIIMAMEAPWRRDEHLATCFIFGGKLIVFCSTQLRGVALWGQTGNCCPNVHGAWYVHIPQTINTST